ncbi:hypothetical protein [Allokutzneria sp. NRRL B-24872]|uniref:hypothetical protein n=1 Tax=Allokutzneria sp. NRRL B-24872 TaxID=1137961 RepID=UPI000A37E541|nr:hypothetical protein [Allokutzneria sp. NRRL B-24872]
MSEQTATAPSAPARTVAVVNAFVAEHGDPTRAVIQYIGNAGVRLTLVGSDGALGDVVVPDVATAEAVCAAVEGVQVSEWDRETVAATVIGPAHRRKMAGPRARK